MKKLSVLTVRVEPDVQEAISLLAEEDERSVAWVTRKLLREALEARQLLTPPEKKPAD
ncbi:hypothetical protein SG34_007190 [Thalassomonas viridans]|uniref:Uncharacterized protein n=1 Tax=Thalassomonas viridans TaxID=137584 RepID=A0AAE9Z4M6_9GAMM|nr:hypothetical protein [Thalassomonas viridans]WDE06681.1 hypothetical protein SG34_007190 [Thalassomonas viridans]